MRRVILIITVFISLNACTQPSAKPVANKPGDKDIRVGGGCEGCEAIYESPVAFDALNEVDTLPGYEDPGPKIEISGTVFKRDGKTPAPGVILYVYHTDQKGIYPSRSTDQGWAKRHGYIRGWVKTNEKGEYRFYTLIPASYPNSNNPKHIHPTIKEPGKTEYWIDEFLFEDDPLLPAAQKNRTSPVGGRGVIMPVMNNGMYRAKRDIILGLNVRDYPTE